jgi:phosphate:Na+ symporter
MDMTILQAFGGIGLFLLGMLIFTDGLKHLAGGLLRRMLARFTRGPLSGAITGALATAVIQSSSATTVTAVGFVGAGLLTFTQALGIIFGANIGTTITGWLVAIIGFKLKLGLVVLPLLMLGVMMRLFASARLRHIGWVLAGFSLLFIGIDMLQDGMAPLKGIVTPERFPADSYFGRLQLLAIGIAITLVTQSSSAGVATALVALGTGALNLPQAAAMVIGMDVGTTFTAALATLGGSTAMRRTGYAHVIYNLLTGVMAFFLLDLYVYFVHLPLAASSSDAQVALVGFHTLFNALGVVLVLPFAAPFGRLVERLVPDAGPPLLRHLDDRLLKDPVGATDAVMSTVNELSKDLLGLLNDQLDLRAPPPDSRLRLGRVRQAMIVTGQYLDQVRTTSDQPDAHRRHLAAMHVFDHLQRLVYRCGQQPRLETLRQEPDLKPLVEMMQRELAALLGDWQPEVHVERFDALRDELREQRHVLREHTVKLATEQQIDGETTLAILDAGRWLHRSAYHVWRITARLQEGELTIRQKNR